MPKLSYIQDSFSSGEFSPAVQGRKSFEKFKSALKRQENYVVGDKGQLVRRMGFRVVATTKSSGEARLIPFEFNADQTYVLEFGEAYMRVFKDESQLGAPYEIVTPWTAAQAAELWYEQINDLVYICHPSIPTQKLARTSDMAWTLTEVDFIDGPYLSKNKTETTLTVTGSGPYTLTFDATDGVNDGSGLVDPSDVGRLIRHEDSSGTDYKVYKVTAITSTTIATATLQYESAASAIASSDDTWRLGAFCARLGYAEINAFHDSRLFLMGNSRVFGSIIDDFENFSPTDVDDYTAPSDTAGLARLLPDRNPIAWALSGPTLQIGTEGSEYQLKPASISDPLTATNNTAERQPTEIGGYKSRPISAQATIFIQRSRRKLHDFFYSLADESFKARNISVLSDAILKDGEGVEEIVYAKEPNSIFYGRCTDGSFFGGTYIRDQQMTNMYRLPLSQGLEVESLAVITSPNEDYSQVWAIIKHVADGVTYRHVCFMEDFFSPASDTDKDKFYFMDLMTTVPAQTSTTVTGASILEGMTIDVVVDGVALTQKTVSGGEFELDFVDPTGSIVHYGIPYIPLIEMLMPEGGNPFGTAHGKIRKIEDVGLNLLNSIGISVGSNNADVEIKDFHNLSPPETGGESPKLFTGDTDRYRIPQGLRRLPTVVIKQEQPYPSEILNVYMDIHVSEK